MRYNKFKPRTGAVVLLCIAVVALWLTAVYGTFEDNRREKYNVVIKPGEVTYGTHSSAVVPMTVTPTRPTTGVPMVSAGAVRSYAHSGHATMPTTSTTKTIHTTSSATVKTIGSGGATGGGMMTGGSSSTNSQRGIVYGSPTISMPALAMASTQSSTFGVQSSEAATLQYRSIGRRRAPGITGDEEEGDIQQDGGKWWWWDGEGWVEISEDNLPVGTTKIEGGRTYRWNGSGWDDITDQGDPGLPVGATPWLFMLVLGALYLVWKKLIIIN